MRRCPYSASFVDLTRVLCAVYVHGIVGSFKLTQTNCPDPTGTSLLSISTIVAIGLSLVVFVVTCAKCVTPYFSPERQLTSWARSFYSHWVHYQSVPFSFALKACADLSSSQSPPHL